MTNYSKMTDADFERILNKKLAGMTAAQLLDLPGIYEIVSEEYNNDILSAWEAEQPEPNADANED